MDTCSEIEKKPAIVKPLAVNPSLPAFMNQDAAEWTIDEVAEYLELNGFKEQSDNFKEQVGTGTSIFQAI